MTAGKDLVSNLKVAEAIRPAAISATTTPVSVDRRGYESVMAVVQTGDITTADGSNYFDLTIVDSDDGVTFAAAAAADCSSGVNLIVKIDSTTLDDNKTPTLGYKGIKRYVSVLATETGTAVGTFGAVIVLGSPTTTPAA